MVKEYAVGEKYYLPVRVREIMDDTYTYPVRIEFENGNGCMDGMNAIKGNPNLLLTADEILIQTPDNERPRYEEIRKRYERALNDVVELGGEIKTLKFENERLSKQNEELGTKVNDLEAELQNAQKSIDYNNKMEKSRTRLVDGQTMTIYRKDKTINVLIDKIVALEMMLDEEREKHNG